MSSLTVIDNLLVSNLYSNNDSSTVNLFGRVRVGQEQPFITNTYQFGFDRDRVYEMPIIAGTGSTALYVYHYDNIQSILFCKTGTSVAFLRYNTGTATYQTSSTPVGTYTNIPNTVNTIAFAISGSNVTITSGANVITVRWSTTNWYWQYLVSATLYPFPCTFLRNTSSVNIGSLGGIVSFVQSRIYSPYQPGGMAVIYATGVLVSQISTGTASTHRIGSYDSLYTKYSNYAETGSISLTETEPNDNSESGHFFQASVDNTGSVILYVVQRSGFGLPNSTYTRTTGTNATFNDYQVPSNNWNITPVPIGGTLYTGTRTLTYAQLYSQAMLFCIARQWLGANACLLGFNIDGSTIWVHKFTNAGNFPGVYMPLGSLPFRYESLCSAAAPAQQAITKAICTSVLQDIPTSIQLRTRSYRQLAIPSNNYIYFRLDPSQIRTMIQAISYTATNTSNNIGTVEVSIVKDIEPTITWNGITGSAVQRSNLTTTRLEPASVIGNAIFGGARNKIIQGSQNYSMDIVSTNPIGVQDIIQVGILGNSGDLVVIWEEST